MTGIPLALAVTAGMLAVVNPCGFALLPAYLSLLVIGDDTSPRRVAVVRALASTAAVTAGFAGAFGLFGLAIAPVADGLQRHLPWFTLGFGLLLAGAGGWLVTGRPLPGPRLLKRGPRVTRSLLSMVGFGAAYALASLSCTIGPFLAIVAANFPAGSPIAGVGAFIAYAAGVGLIVGTVALAVALARTVLVDRLRRAAAVTTRLGGLVLLLAGGYLAYYGSYEIRVLHDGTAIDPVVEGAVTAQRWLAGGVDRIGAPAMAAGFGLLLAAGLVTGWVHRRTHRSTGRT